MCDEWLWMLQCHWATYWCSPGSTVQIWEGDIQGTYWTMSHTLMLNPSGLWCRDFWATCINKEALSFDLATFLETTPGNMSYNAFRMTSTRNYLVYFSSYSFWYNFSSSCLFVMQVFLTKHYRNRRTNDPEFVLDLEEIYVIDSKTKSITRARVLVWPILTFQVI